MITYERYKKVPQRYTQTVPDDKIRAKGVLDIITFSL